VTDPSKYFDGESLAEHQARTRVDDPSNRTYNYALIGGARFMGASAARAIVVGLLASLNPASDVLALASIEVDVSNLQPGNCMTVKWRGKPVFIRARTGTATSSRQCAQRSPTILIFSRLEQMRRSKPPRLCR